jgi:phage terminase large subunit GpA-like protein
MLHCPICGEGIQEYQKTEMLAKGKWVAQNPGHWRAGFHLSSLYSPVGWYSWARAVREFDEAGTNPEKKQVFTNTFLGLPFDTGGETVAYDYLQRRAEDYEAEVPDGVLLIVMAVDVQKHYLRYEIQGYGKDEERWGLYNGRIDGSTTELGSGFEVRGKSEASPVTTGEVGLTHRSTPTDEAFPSAWVQLEEVMKRKLVRSDGREMNIARVFIDSGGVEGTTDTVYNFCAKWDLRNVCAVKGSNQAKDPICSARKRDFINGRGFWRYRIGTFEAKRLIYSRLKIEVPGPGYFHFPKDENRGYDAVAYNELTVERLITEYKNGYKKLKWWKPKEARNELLDLAVYGLSVVRDMKPNWVALGNLYRNSEVGMRSSEFERKDAKDTQRTQRVNVDFYDRSNTGGREVVINV